MGVPQMIEGLVQKYGSINAASRETKIPVTTLFRLYHGEHKEPTLSTLRMIAADMDVPLYELVRILEDEDETPAAPEKAASSA